MPIFLRGKSASLITGLIISLVLGILLALGLGAPSPTLAGRSILVVDNLGDGVDEDTSPGQTTLREALEMLAVPGDHIVFAPALNGQTIALSNTLAIDKDLSLDGGGQITISGGNLRQVFFVGQSATAHISGTTIADGYTRIGGAGIYVDAGSTVTLTNSTLTNHFANSYGGAIYNAGDLAVQETTFSYNTTNAGGGAIYNYYGNVTVESSLIYSNSAASTGGGLSNSGELYVTNSTLSFNYAGLGGGVYNDNGFFLTLTHVTLAENWAELGGGIYNQGSLWMYNSLAAQSFGSGDCYNESSVGTINDNISNLIQDGRCNQGKRLTGFLSGDPNLDQLADNGGPTWTQALRLNSPALDSGDSHVCAQTDQRAVPRPQGDECDRGAFERVPNSGGEFLIGYDAGVCTEPKDGLDYIQRMRAVDVNFTALGGLEIGPSLAGTLSGQFLVLDLFPDVILSVLLSQLRINPEGGYIWVGQVDQQPTSEVFLSVDPASGHLVGYVYTSDGRYEINPSPTGDYHCVAEVSEDALLTIEDGLPPPPNSIGRSTSLYSDRAALVADNGSLLDVMVVYTPEARNEAGGTGAIQSLAQAFVERANQANANSGVNHRLWLVHVAEVAYSRLSCASPGSCHGVDLDRLTGSSDGFMDDVHTLRNTYHADLVLLIVRDAGAYSTGGVAWLASGPTAPDNREDSAFGLGTLGCAKGLCLVHEAGHIRGLNHDWFQNAKQEPFTFGHGHINTAAGFRTIMAYRAYCDAVAANCDLIPNFSNPNITFNGVSTGVASGTNTGCQKNATNPNPTTCDADSRQALNSTDAAVAQFRSSQITWTGAASSDWADGNNWSMQEGPATAPVLVQRTPRTIDDVVIPTAPVGGRFPTLGSPVTVRNLIVETGAVLTMTGGSLNVLGQWEEEGTGHLVATGGTVALNGSLPQVLVMNPLSNLFHVQVGGSGSGRVTLGSDLDVQGDLALQAGAILDGGSGGHVLRVKGSWSDAGAAFIPGDSHVHLVGSSQSIDKVTTSTILSETFDQFTVCCTSGVPAGWRNDSTAFFQGPLFSHPSPTANRWNDKADGWLFSSPLSLNSGVSYQLEYKVATNGLMQNLTVALGDGQSSGAMTQILDSATNVNNLTLATRTASFNVSATGTYYLGFRSQQVQAGFMMFDDVILRSVQNLVFTDLTVESGVTTFQQDVEVTGNLTVMPGATLNMSTNNLAVDGTVTNNGTLRQTLDVPAGTTIPIVQVRNRANTTTAYAGVTLAPNATGLGLTTVRIRGNQPTCWSGFSLAHRCFDIAPTNAQAATVRFWYLDSELGGMAADQMGAYHWNGTDYDTLTLAGTPRGVEGPYRWVETVNVADFSPFVLADEDPDGPVATTTPTATPTNTPTVTPTTTPTATDGPSPTPTHTPTTTPTATDGPSPTPTSTPTVTPTVTNTPIPLYLPAIKRNAGQ